MVRKELFPDILINSQAACGLNTDIVSEQLLQRKKTTRQVLANWNTAGNIGKHNWSHLSSVLHLASNSPLCYYKHKCSFTFEVA